MGLMDHLVGLIRTDIQLTQNYGKTGRKSTINLGQKILLLEKIRMFRLRSL